MWPLALYSGPRQILSLCSQRWSCPSWSHSPLPWQLDTESRATPVPRGILRGCGLWGPATLLDPRAAAWRLFA